MKITSLATACAAALGLALVQPAMAQSRAPTDTGNMAYPTPQQSGIYGTSTITGPKRPTDTGNMAYPASVASGVTGTARIAGPNRPTDTGNMAYPAPVASGITGGSAARR